MSRQFFLSSLGVSKHRVNSIAKAVFNGDIPKGKREGDRKSTKSAEKRSHVRAFIQTLPAKESHTIDISPREFICLVNLIYVNS